MTYLKLGWLAAYALGALGWLAIYELWGRGAVVVVALIGVWLAVVAGEAMHRYGSPVTSGRSRAMMEHDDQTDRSAATEVSR